MYDVHTNTCTTTRSAKSTDHLLMSVNRSVSQSFGIGLQSVLLGGSNHLALDVSTVYILQCYLTFIHIYIYLYVRYIFLSADLCTECI
jgi:hypothetical protein